MSAEFPTDAEREVTHDAGLAVCDCHDYPEAERTSAVLSALAPLIAAREAAARRAGAVEALRDTAESWRSDEPQRSTYAHAKFFARELDNRAERIKEVDDDHT